MQSIVRLRRLFLPFCLLTIFPGCENARVPNVANYDFNGGRYFVRLADTAGQVALNFHSKGEGPQITDERYEITWGQSHTLLIINGALQIDGTDFGKLNPGDRVNIDVSGKPEIVRAAPPK